MAAIGTLVGLGITSGLNLYATVFATGLAIRLGWVDLPSALDGLGVLADWRILIVSGVLYAIEFVADKIPLVEHAWDFLHTFVRPLGAVWLGLVATSQAHLSAPAEVMLLLVMGSAAFTAHLGKAGTRLASTGAGGPVVGANFGLSVLEDLFSLGIAPLAISYPWAVLVAAIGVLAAIAVLVPVGFRYVRSLFRS